MSYAKSVSDINRPKRVLSTADGELVPRPMFEPFLMRSTTLNTRFNEINLQQQVHRLSISMLDNQMKNI